MMEKTIKGLPETIQKALKKVTKDQIIMLRQTGEEFVVLKFGEILYAYKIQEEKEPGIIKEAFGTHKCSVCANFCENGQLCPKVSDFSVETTRRYAVTEEDAQKESKRIEKYPIILKGVECFNSFKEYLVVEECSNFKKNNDKEERDDLCQKCIDEFFYAEARLALEETKCEC